MIFASAPTLLVDSSNSPEKILERLKAQVSPATSDKHNDIHFAKLLNHPERMDLG